MATKEQRIVKATFSLGVDLVARINAKALLLGQSRDALATAALEEACKGLVLFDRGRPSRRSESKDRPAEESPVEDPDEKAA